MKVTITLNDVTGLRLQDGNYEASVVSARHDHTNGDVDFRLSIKIHKDKRTDKKRRRRTK